MPSRFPTASFCRNRSISSSRLKWSRASIPTNLSGTSKRSHAGRTGNYLVLLTRHGVSEEHLREVVAKSKQRGVIFKHVTFEQLCDQLADFAREHETHLHHVVEDFPGRTAWRWACYLIRRQWLADRALWSHDPSQRQMGRVIISRRTVVTHHTSSSVSTTKRKSSTLAGVVAVYDNSQAKGKMVLTLVEGAEDKPEFQQRIVSMVQDTKAQVGWDVSDDHRFFCVEKFLPTSFRKNLSRRHHGDRVSRTSPLTSRLGVTDDKVAAALNGQTWE